MIRFLAWITEPYRRRARRRKLRRNDPFLYK